MPSAAAVAAAAVICQEIGERSRRRRNGFARYEIPRNLPTGLPDFSWYNIPKNQMNTKLPDGSFVMEIRRYITLLLKKNCRLAQLAPRRKVGALPPLKSCPLKPLDVPTWTLNHGMNHLWALF
jgi:hypothetical protein